MDDTDTPDTAAEPAAPAAGGRRAAIALVGRPNVGKSALFNRIARSRIAIVHEEEGVTRDRLERTVDRDGRRFSLADTGGIFALDGERVADRIDAGVRAQALAALDGGEEAVSALLSSLFSRGVPVVECRVEAANLEDVFMNVTKGDIA